MLVCLGVHHYCSTQRVLSQEKAQHNSSYICRQPKMSSIDRRSASPQCPKPNEPEPPEGTAMAEDISGRDSPSSEMQDIMGGIITSEMVEEEKKLMKEGQKKEQALMEKARAVWEKDAHDMRFSRLQFLLEKSNIYAKFLLTKMEQQHLEEQKRKEKLEKKAASVKQENVGLKAKDKNTGKKVGQRKRGREEDYKISDVMSKEEILNKAKKKKAETEEEEDKQQKTLLAEDLEKMSDSTFEIKDRLAQTVRHNSQHLFHPDRKVDGQPVPYQQPKIFTGGVMRWYQVEGMEWLRMLWENGINGILADEMGLGKTVQCIATIAMIVERGVRGPFLVVGPLSTLPNWMSEFNRFTPEISVILYHGHPQEREKVLRSIKQQQGPLQMNPVVITSYEIAMKDRRKLQFLHWKYLIVDEGHRIKNINCRLVQELKQFNSDNKLLLTGTPLQNNLAELWSLLNFLLPDVFDDLKSFESWFDISSVTTDAENTIAQEREQNILHMLHQILTPFLLRRLKCDVALEVPPKREVVVFAPLTPKQEKFYTAVVNRTIQKMLGVSEDKNPTEVTSVGRPKRRSVRAVDYCELYEDSPQDLEKLIAKLQKEADYQQSRPVVNVQEPRDAEIHLKMQNVLMLLKRCCNHPYLIEYPLDPATQDFKVDEQLVQNSGKFLVLDRMLPELRKRGHKVLIFSQMTSILDILMDYCYLRGFQYSRLDGSMSFSEREENMRKFNCDSEVFLFLLSTRAGGLGINLTAADTVIIFDSDWNPQADLQAQDRCHRIGQTKPVMVYRLVTANTIDQKIVERAAAKRKLEKMVIHKNKFKGGTTGFNSSKSCLAPDELMELLKSRDYDREIKGTGSKVISDKDLKDLLDRSDLIDQMKKRSKKEKKGLYKVLENTDDGDIQLS